MVAALERAADTDEVVLMSAPNWAEVRYIVQRKVGSEGWQEVRAAIMALPLEVVAADESLAELAGSIKADRRMSLADCFAAALAQQWDAELYTGDPEFKAVEDAVKVVWL